VSIGENVCGMAHDFRVEFGALLGKRIAEGGLGNQFEELPVGRIDAVCDCHTLFV